MNEAQGEWGAWLALRAVRGVGNVVGLGLVKVFGGARQVLDAGGQRLECAGVRRGLARAIAGFDDWAWVAEQLRRLDRVGGRLVTWADESYPELLRHIHDPPLFLYVRGNLEDALGPATPAVAVVGSRAPSNYGRRMARELAAGLAERGLTVVSGLARGVDAEAHWAALRAGGRTVAVLGNGIDVIYPTEHHRLMVEAANNGAVVSEFPMGTQPDAENFPGRNRIISGMSLGTVVVEAAERSGSLITAHFAMEQGREVFAVPGPVGIRSRGPHRLLRQGATLAENANDVLSELAPHLPAQRAVVVELAPRQAAVMGCLADGPRGLDEIARASGLEPAAVIETLLGLELRGAVVALPGQRYAAATAAPAPDPAR